MDARTRPLTLKKRAARRGVDRVEMYANEYSVIDSTTSALEACGGCHKLTEVHGKTKTVVGSGAGFNAGVISGTVTANTNGTVTATLQAGEGAVSSFSKTWSLFPGPRIIVSSGTSLHAAARQPVLSGSSAGTATARQDKTRR